MFVPDVPFDIQDRAAKGPHAHWSSVGFNLEGGRLHMIQEEASSPRPDPARIAELKEQVVSLVQSMAYGETDSFYRLFGLSCGTRVPQDEQSWEVNFGSTFTRIPPALSAL